MLVSVRHACNLILCHNHPSRNLKPSRADEELTRKIKEAGMYLDIKVIDHIIITSEGYYSLQMKSCCKLQVYLSIDVGYN
jgi:DNA repair protein RadC